MPTLPGAHNRAAGLTAGSRLHAQDKQNQQPSPCKAEGNAPARI